MESLKLGFFCWESLRGVRLGGLANAATHLAEALAKEHEVHYFTRGDYRDRGIAGVAYHYCQPAGVDIVDCMRDMSRLMVDDFMKAGGGFDVLHFHDWHPVEALRALQDRSTVLSFHSTAFGRNGNMAAPDRFYREVSAIEQDGACIARQVTAVSGVLRDEVVDLYGVPVEKCRVVPNGVVPSEYQRTVDRAQVRQDCGVPPVHPCSSISAGSRSRRGPISSSTLCRRCWATILRPAS